MEDAKIRHWNEMLRIHTINLAGTNSEIERLKLKLVNENKMKIHFEHEIIRYKKLLGKEI